MATTIKNIFIYILLKEDTDVDGGGGSITPDFRGKRLRNVEGTNHR